MPDILNMDDRTKLRLAWGSAAVLVAMVCAATAWHFLRISPLPDPSQILQISYFTDPTDLNATGKPLPIHWYSEIQYRMKGARPASRPVTDPPSCAVQIETKDGQSIRVVLFKFGFVEIDGEPYEPRSGQMMTEIASRAQGISQGLF
ncbi:MAG: hypothetical protein E4H02_06980 [Lentisphaerales bacterium]|jgi:hypothetical protein|nr:MAG: hypothetical protein E4H02_06980 [Lentisphaerales bacterium]